MGNLRGRHVQQPVSGPRAIAPSGDPAPVDGLEWRRPFWYAVYFDLDGIRRRRSTGCRAHEVDKALARRAELEREDPDTAHRAPAPEATVGGVLEDFVNNKNALVLQGKRSAATIAFYRQKAGLVRGFFETALRAFPVRELTSRKIDEYITQRRRDGADDSTTDKELKIFRAALKAAKRRGECQLDLDVLFSMPEDFDAGYVPVKRFLTKEQFPRLIAELPPHRAAVVAFVVATSCEYSAIWLARRGDVVLERNKPTLARVHGTKRATREREVPLVADEQIAFVEFALRHAGADVLFKPWGSMRRDLQMAVARANALEEAVGRPPLPPISPNDLRRTAGSWLRAEGIALDHVAKVMGHKTSKMVELVYGQLTTNELATLMRRAIGKAPILEPKPKKEEADSAGPRASHRAAADRLRTQKAKRRSTARWGLRLLRENPRVYRISTRRDRPE